MPPTAATIGSAAVFGSRRSPLTSSYLISSPTTKKKITIRASLTQCCSVSSSRSCRGRCRSTVCQNASYDDAPRASWPRPARRRPRRAAAPSPPPRRAGTRGPGGRPGGPAACCSRGRTGRAARRRRRRRRRSRAGRIGVMAAAFRVADVSSATLGRRRADQTSRLTVDHPTGAGRAARLRVGSATSAPRRPAKDHRMATEPVKDTDPTIGRLVIDASRDISS